MASEEWELKSDNYKWSKFIVTAIREKNGVIVAVKLGKDDNGRRIIDIKEISKDTIIKLLNNGEEIITAYKKHGVFHKGSLIKVYDIEHFRTDPNNKGFDNLDKLERF